MRHLTDLKTEIMAKNNVVRVLFAILLTSLVTHGHAEASSSRPIEVKSDPYGVGNPTHYSILRGSSRVTFSHPFAGQFTRAEIMVREKSGTKLTRFLLAKDGKSYQPTLQIDTPFEKHFSLAEDELCTDPKDPGPLDLVKILKPKVDDGLIIAKKRDELVKAGFFDKSCFASNIKQEHRDAIMNAVADVFATETQDSAPEPKYLRCLEKNGFAHESGIIQSLLKQSITKPQPQSRLRLACTSDQKAKPAVYDEDANLITMRTSRKPEREDYGKKIFHEILHPIPIRDGNILATAEECCTNGLNCNLLRAYSVQRHKGEKLVTSLEFIKPNNAVSTSITSIALGPIIDSTALIPPTESIKTAEQFSLTEENTTRQCKELGEPTCSKMVHSELTLLQSTASNLIGGTCPAVIPDDKIGATNSILHLLIPASKAADDCGTETIFRQIATKRAAETAIRKNDAPRTLGELADRIPQTSPISWDADEAKPVPVRLAGDSESRTNASTPERIPTRTIASVSPLPEPKAQRQLGSMKNRTDVSAGRATAIIDPIEKVARELSARLTPEVLELKKVERNQIFAKDFKSKSNSPQFMVVSSVKNPITIADVSSLKNIGFPNPFASASDADAASSPSGRSPAVGDTRTQSPVIASRPGKLPSKTVSGNAVTDVDTGTAALGTKNSAQAPRMLPEPISQGTATASARAQNKPARSIASAKSHEEFKAMERMDLVRFITSGFRNVSPELENPALAEALVKNKIQILDHENRKIGSMTPEMTFIYRTDLGRLVQTRVERARK